MERLPRAKYTQEFRQEAVKLVVEQKLSTSEAARRLQLSPNTLDNWLRKYREGKLGEIGQNYLPPTEEEMELTRLRRENAELKMERDFLKKAAAYVRHEGVR